ncbi:putative DNA binding domain-containing protein [Pseudomonadales bacterium]|nr:putative DNA binding domain-containing protein [Pseudomonadales bacterium]
MIDFFSEHFNLQTLVMVIYVGAAFLIIAAAVKDYISIKKKLRDYIQTDFSQHEGWTVYKLVALREGVNKGHDIERLSDDLNQSQASVRTKLVKDKVYDEYLERQVIIGEAKFAEWQKLKRKVGKIAPIKDEQLFEDSEEPKESLSPDWKLIQSLSENWFDPRLEFCETFYTSPVSKLADPRTQHELIKHVAAFLNTAGGQVLIGFGKKGKLLGLLDDDIRTMHHYQNRIEETLRKALGKAALPFINISMIRWGSEDVCYIACEKASYQVTCTHQKYNDMAGHEKRQKLIYRRVNAQSVYDVVAQPSTDDSKNL